MTIVQIDYCGYCQKEKELLIVEEQYDEDTKTNALFYICTGCGNESVRITAIADLF